MHLTDTRHIQRFCIKRPLLVWPQLLMFDLQIHQYRRQIHQDANECFLLSWECGCPQPVSNISHFPMLHALGRMCTENAGRSLEQYTVEEMLLSRGHQQPCASQNLFLRATQRRHVQAHSATIEQQLTGTPTCCPESDGAWPATPPASCSPVYCAAIEPSASAACISKTCCVSRI
jgi:hypothetical protein